MLIVYGIKNCDTVKRARRWLDERGLAYRFHDLRTDGLEKARLEAWCRKIGWEKLLNRKGTTWRQLPASAKEALGESQAFALLQQHPTLIKRPVIEAGDHLVIGFDQDEYQRAFG